MQLLFKEVIQTCFSPIDDCLKKLNSLVESSNSARDTKDQNKTLNQYDEAEMESHRLNQI